VIAWWTVVRALFGYCFLVFIVRIVGRRPGKQLTPFEFVLVFFLGGLTLTGMVGDEVSLTNALCQIITVAAAHAALTWLRSRSEWWTKVLDGTALILLEGGCWRSRTMLKMRVADDDVMAMARDKGLRTLSEIDTAVLERHGGMSVLSKDRD
jgi:uncharacterized membrane protein YcaP (DUF421 family)